MYVSLGILLICFLTVHGEMIQCFVGSYNFSKYILVCENRTYIVTRVNIYISSIILYSFNENITRALFNYSSLFLGGIIDHDVEYGKQF